ncbi:MAG: molybdopterin-dependent oxidoreductase [Pirellulaceae bacterium]
MVDPRITPIARTCDLFLPVKPGRDIALFNGVLQLMIENDWLDHDFIEQHTVGFDALAQSVQAWTPARTAEVTGIAERSIRQAAEWWGTASTSFLMHARGIEHHSHGVQNVLGAINIVLASGRIGRKNCGYATITGQANGQGGREHGQKCDQLPGARDLVNPEHRAHVAKVWDVSPDDLPGPGVDAYELFRKIDRGEIRGLLSLCFNPLVSLPDSNFVRRMLDKLDFYVAIDFFLNDTARHADIVLPGSLQEEDEGTVTQIEGRVIKINQAVEPQGTRSRIGASCKISPLHSGGRMALRSKVRGRSLTNCGMPVVVGWQTTTVSLERSSSSMVSAGRVPPRIIRARRGCLSQVRPIQSPATPDRSIFPTARRGSMWLSIQHPRKTSMPNILSS